jgi:hypothetical protein
MKRKGNEEGVDEELEGGEGLGWRRRRKGWEMGQLTLLRSPTLYLVSFKTRTGVHTG